MKLELKRLWLGEEATIGKLFVDGVEECYTLEDRVREIEGKPVEEWKVHGKTAIPVGTYRVIIDFSNRYQRRMPHVLDVKGFTGIRFHSGNKAVDTDGCVLTGREKQGDATILRSREAFREFFGKLTDVVEEGEEVWLTVTNEPIVDTRVVAA